MASSPEPAKLPTPVAPVQSADIKLGDSTKTDERKKVQGLKQLQIKKSTNTGLTSDNSTGLSS